MLSDWRPSRERDAHTRCPDMGPRSASRLAGLRRSLRNGKARFERARKVVLPPSRAPILEEPYPACTHAHTTG